MTETAASATRRSYGLAVVLAGALAIVAAEFAVITAQNAPRPGLSPAALNGVLPAGAAGAPSLTWTNARPDPVGTRSGPSTHGLLLAAACTGGGAIGITLSTGTSLDLDCASATTAGPLRLDRTQISPNTISVQTTSGNPRYIVKLIATDA